MRKPLFVAVLAALVLLVVGVASSATSEVTWWQPGSAEPLPLHWALSDAIDVNNPRHVGERSFLGAVLPPPAVLDIDGEFNTAGTVATLHARGQKAICYFDAGVFETYRSDAASFPTSVIGRKDGNWEGSYWLDIRRLDVLEPIMRNRIAMCVAKGFDMIEPDEIDGWENATGFPLTYADQLNYNRHLFQWAHEAGIAILQKGDIIQTQDLVEPLDPSLPLGYADAVFNEECYRYRECLNPWNPVTGQEQVGLQAYSSRGKAVWVAEYNARPSARMCNDAPARHWNGARYKLGLPNSGGRNPCAGW